MNIKKNALSFLWSKAITHNKKFLLSLFMISALSAAQHNFYIGTNVGTAGFSVKTSDVVSNDGGAVKNFYTNKSIKSNGIIGGMYLGYILRLQNFGIGAEVSWQYMNLDKTLDGRFDDAGAGDHLYFTIKNKLTSQFEFAVKPGYFIHDYFTYVVLGVNLQNIHRRYSAAGQTGVAGEIQNFSGKKSKYIAGYTFGVGVQKNIYEHIALGLEIKTTRFSKRNYQFDLPYNPRDSEITLSSKLKNIQTYSCSLRFMYTF